MGGWRARIRGEPSVWNGRSRRHHRPRISSRRRSSPGTRTNIGRRWKVMLPEAAHHHPPALAHHFDDLARQREAATLGMWVFLVTEILFFGGLFLVYSVYRSWY